MFCSDVTKIKYIEEGYLPNHPFWLISDAEMCDAFLSPEGQSGFFYDFYPCPDPQFEEVYQHLIESIRFFIAELKAQPAITQYELPDWIQSYMLGAVVGPNSLPKEVDDLNTLLGVPNVDEAFTDLTARMCIQISQKWINKIPLDDRTVRRDGTLIDIRPVTCFGEPHVIKSLRANR